jgi:hypothetical protein
MRVIAFLLLSLSTLCAQRSADKTDAKNPYLFRLGAKSVCIPPPQGFTDVIGRIENDHGRFADRQIDGLLAIDVPDDIIVKLSAEPLMSLPIYTNVRVAREMLTMDVSQELYNSIVSEYQKNFERLLDPNGKIAAAAKKEMSLHVSQVTGRLSNVDLAATKNLGYFQRTDSVFSALTLMTIDVNGQPIPMLVSVSLLRLNDRLVNAAVYKRMPTQRDIETLPEFTKQWTEAIVAANK